jgi:hypothetical protein
MFNNSFREYNVVSSEYTVLNSREHTSYLHSVRKTIIDLVKVEEITILDKVISGVYEFSAHSKLKTVLVIGELNTRRFNEIGISGRFVSHKGILSLYPVRFVEW